MTQKAPEWTLALRAMLSVQLSSALSVGLIDQIGPAGTAWLRTTVGAIIFIAVLRPSLLRIRRRDLPSLALGATTAAMSMLFLAAIQRIPAKGVGRLTLRFERLNAHATTHVARAR